MKLSSVVPVGICSLFARGFGGEVSLNPTFFNDPGSPAKGTSLVKDGSITGRKMAHRQGSQGRIGVEEVQNKAQET